MKLVTYEYTEANRFLNPHSYMYTHYLGVDFLQAYVNDRSKNIKFFKSTKHDGKVNEIDKYFYSAAKFILEEGTNPLAYDIKKYEEYLRSLSQMTEISTVKLLESLIHIQLSKKVRFNTKSLIDFLVQRFEVTKKIHENYHSKELRYGSGDNTIVRLYWLFSLLLSLFYAETKNIKYLNTLLKVNDLLCSLNHSLLVNLPSRGVEFILKNEVRNIIKIENNMENSTIVFK